MSQSPYHSLSPQERAIFKERKELLAYVAKRFREEVIKHEDFLRLPTPLPGMSKNDKFLLILNFLYSYSEGPTPTPSGIMLLHRTTSRARSLMTDKTGDVNLK